MPLVDDARAIGALIDKRLTEQRSSTIRSGRSTQNRASAGIGSTSQPMAWLRNRAPERLAGRSQQSSGGYGGTSRPMTCLRNRAPERLTGCSQQSSGGYGRRGRTGVNVWSMLQRAPAAPPGGEHSRVVSRPYSEPAVDDIPASGHVCARCRQRRHPLSRCKTPSPRLARGIVAWACCRWKLSGCPATQSITGSVDRCARPCSE